jgi:Ser/Thr protein kinase RdoA (MazF antagonist)
MSRFLGSPISAGSVPTGEAGRAGSARDAMTPEELAVVLSHYGLGILESVTEFPKGSRRAPKLMVTSEQGKFLLKRRAKGRDDPFKVAFCHAIQLHLAAKGFPLPALIGTKRENNSMLQWRGGVYELFEYIQGQPYPQTAEATRDSGRVLAVFHSLLDGFRSEWQPGGGSYHGSQYVEQAVKQIPSVVAHGANSDVEGTLSLLMELYQQCVAEVEKAGFATWPQQVVHGDWHPGNMLFRDNLVVAVIDYDSARLLPRAIDIANGALQFSIIGDEEDVSFWPAEIDEKRYREFLAGYDGVMLVSKAELRMLPWLMIEALIAEAVIPIAATGMFGRTEGMKFLEMVKKKVAWLKEHAGRLGAEAVASEPA